MGRHPHEVPSEEASREMPPRSSTSLGCGQMQLGPRTAVRAQVVQEASGGDSRPVN